MYSAYNGYHKFTSCSTINNNSRYYKISVDAAALNFVFELYVTVSNHLSNALSK